MPQINCPNCQNQFFADSPGAFVTSAGFAVVGALFCRFCFGHLIINGIDMDMPRPPIDARIMPRVSANPSGSDHVHGVSLLLKELTGLIGYWGVIGLFVGAVIGMAVDHFSRRCPKCGFKQ